MNQDLIDKDEEKRKALATELNQKQQTATATPPHNPDDKDKVIFGQNSNQSYHTWRHVDKLGLDRTKVEGVIRTDLNKNITNVKTGQLYNGNVTVNGKALQYTAFRRADGVINIGRIIGK
ncbi:hypothetical protein [Acinetobacter boissieri]|uniref:Uncharacterized protein n=1 Tax=Acinetobacter boissieri TaxID=1219383 RepID=A0A1G6H3N8_9GAMM|nr:hypothetical protein [Acinetobacter boissieri]SDB88764.1 hypothetical protein SAMN05421733_103244 [Acinetobacter boissieri]